MLILQCFLKVLAIKNIACFCKIKQAFYTGIMTIFVNIKNERKLKE